MDRPDGSRPKPVNITAALAAFDEIYSPRIAGRMNDYDVKIAHARGEHVWHVHEATDEFFLVGDGTLNISMGDAAGAGGERCRSHTGAEARPRPRRWRRSRRAHAPMRRVHRPGSRSGARLGAA